MDVVEIRLVRGDITKLEVDAIVNAANTGLLPGGGVCGAIHGAGGSTIASECAAWVREHGPVRTGGAAITNAGKLPARYVVHAVGPVWSGGGSGEDELLASAYRSSIELADIHGVESIAFPSISTGIYGYPVEHAAPVAIAAVNDALGRAKNVREVVFALFDGQTYDAYERALADATS